MKTIPELEEGTHRAKATGTLPNGKPVIVNADGTVSVVAETSTDITQNLGGEVNFPSSAESWHVDVVYDENSQKVIVVYTDRDNSSRGTAIVGTVSGTDISFGAATVFQTTSTDQISAAYDSNNQKIVIGYENAGGSNFGTVVVGTVSGTSISFGTPVVFNSGRTALSDGIKVVHDESAGKIVILYSDDALTGDPNKAVVGTVSGTSISFGTPVTFNANGQGYITALYDPNSQNVIVAYRGASPFYGNAIAGTVSGTSISFGSNTTFNSSSSRLPSIAYDTANQKIVVAYSDLGNSNYGTAVVGTVSGTSITFGTPVVFESGSVGTGEETPISASYHASSGKVVISYTDVADSNSGKLVDGTVSGTSISFETIVEFENQSTFYIGSAYDPDTQQVVIAYENDPQDTGKAFMFRPNYTEVTTNLTSENYIGIAKGAAADTAVATIQTGCSINDAQSGLTAGQDYYVQTDGTLGLTPANPSVLAGTAVSATEIIVKG